MLLNQKNYTPDQNPREKINQSQVQYLSHFNSYFSKIALRSFRESFDSLKSQLNLILLKFAERQLDLNKFHF